MADIRQDLRYTSDHEWALAVDARTVRVGITDYAQNSLGDIVFVSVHSVADTTRAGDVFGEVESTKSVSDLFAPVTGTLTRSNDALTDNPELVNSDPYGEGWIAEFAVDDAGVLSELLDAAAYQDVIGE